MAEPVEVVEVDNRGLRIPSNLPQTLTYNADGTVATIAQTNGAYTWTQTYSYTAGRVTAISAWVKS